MNIKRCKKIMWIATVTLEAVLLMVVVCYATVVWNASGRTYDSVSDIPHNRVGLLLAIRR